MNQEPKVTIVTSKSGKKYAYTASEHVWDKEKKQCRTRLRYYGTVDQDGKVHPKRQRLTKASVRESDGDRNLSIVSEKHVGLTRALSRISEEIHLSEVLREKFPKTWRTILSVAMYHVCTGSGAAYLFPSWAEENETPIDGEAITSQGISGLYSQMTEARRKEFLISWRKAASTGSACFHDITSISSYSQKSDLVEYGYNRDKEDLPQINIGLVADSGNRLPVYYRIHDGSINDVSTLRHVLSEGYAFNMEKLTFVMDKGFYSKQNISMMYRYRYHFIVSMTFATNAACNAVDEVRDAIRHPANIVKTSNDEYLYAKAVRTHWNSDSLDRNCTIHVCTKMVSDIQVRSGNLDIRLRECLDELNAGLFIPVHAPLYAKYFIERRGDDGSRSYEYNEQALKNSENRYSGYLCIVTDNADMTSAQVIDIYRDKDGIEKIFDDIKNVQDCRRLNVQSRPAMEGKLFIVFIASILISEIRQRMKNGYSGQIRWTVDLIRRNLNKIQMTEVQSSGTRRTKLLMSILSRTQKEFLSALLNVELKQVELALKSIIV